MTKTADKQSLIAIAKLQAACDLPDADLAALIDDPSAQVPLAKAADAVRREVYGDAVYIRGLIELTNYCKNDCYYCGIRRSNTDLPRYRLSMDDVLACAAEGYTLGFRTFVLQGGEDPYFTEERVCGILQALKARHPDCAVTLSLGEWPAESYRRFFEEGADRYLLRHETADACHYRALHPDGMTLAGRKDCLQALADAGFQVGSGFMVGSPKQTTAHLVGDIRYLQTLNPDMIGIGPYLSHKDTPFKDEENGCLEKTLRLISILRLMFPYALIPATTALGTIAPAGRERGLQAGANVIMPNLSPTAVRHLYSLYDNKKHTGTEAAQLLSLLKARVNAAGYKIVVHRGDVSKCCRT